MSCQGCGRPQQMDIGFRGDTRAVFPADAEIQDVDFYSQCLRMITTHRIIVVVCDHIEEPINIRMFARIGAGIVGVLCI